VFQLRDNLSYSVTVTNQGSEPATGVVISNEVPPEIDVHDVPLIPQAASITLSSLGRSETIIWTLDRLAPGRSVSLPWAGEVGILGDFVADNRVTAESEGATSRAEDRIFLAGASTRADTGSTSEPRTIVKKKRIVRHELRTLAGNVVPAAPGPSSLPSTGTDVVGWIIAALSIAVLGALIFVMGRRGKLRRVHVFVILCLLLTACIQDQQPTATPDRTEVGESGDEDEEQVKGKRVRRGQDQNGNAADEAGEPDDTEATGDGALAEQALAPDQPLEPEITTDEVVRVPVVEVVEVSVPVPDPSELGPVAGDNTISYTWDEAEREITAAASGRILRPDATTSLLAGLSVQAPFIGVDVELTNTGSDQVRANGTLVLSITDSAGGLVTTLESRAIDEILGPGDSVSARFSYALPTGDYLSTATFEAN
jgi:uncharacterized repeat protein (TIGR01451 family)